MRHARLTLALDAGAIALPETGRIVVFAPTAEADLSALPAERVQIVQGFKPDHDAWAARGYDVRVAPEGDFAAAVVFVPRAKDKARALLTEAVALVQGGPVIVDGARTDGIDSLLKDCRKRAEVGAPLSKAHGKIFALTAAPAAFADWAGAPKTLPEGFRTRPGVFSADAVDRGSALLADALPAKLKGRVADLGAGWGYLAVRALADHPGISELHLVEADFDALACARENVADPRARFHWADATAFAQGAPFDVVITNPPFHTGRAADPGLGRAFLVNAARILGRSGILYAVANRHLPYERILGELFHEVVEIGGDSGFKVIRAAKPKALPRGRG
ncbi:methyltransferase [Actibacterium sp. MT2.3-13A]|uniref:class I SAM-dependent methyltransferase n=1 Tax=Actibacterium sp. MT2.3-13A TaxID=2828332 RepID=UPI001BAD7F89|nr:methyltransferase [Actibacterium sp. MT2.3-13A]